MSQKPDKAIMIGILWYTVHYIYVTDIIQTLSYLKSYVAYVRPTVKVSREERGSLKAVIVITFCLFVVNTTASFSLISVACFGAMWPTEFSRMYPSTSTTLGYSYFLALVTIPLTVLAGICALIDFKGTWKADEIREQFGTDEVEEEVDEEEEEDLGESIDEGESRNKSTSV